VREPGERGEQTKVQGHKVRALNYCTSTQSQGLNEKYSAMREKVDAVAYICGVCMGGLYHPIRRNEVGSYCSWQLQLGKSSENDVERAGDGGSASPNIKGASQKQGLRERAFIGPVASGRACPKVRLQRMGGGLIDEALGKYMESAVG